MQVKTLAALSLVGMLLSSAAVWSLTKPLPVVAGPETPEVPTSLPGGGGSPEETAEFTAGRTLLLDGRFGHPVLASDKEEESFVFARVRAPAGSTASAARLNLAIVLDRSGSMRGRKLENAISAARGMVDRLRSGDVVSLVAYNTGTSVVVPPTVIDAGARTRVLAAIAGITAQGDTCISCGMETAIGLLREHGGMVDRMLLLSDGEATAGIKDEAGFRALATSLRERDIAVSSIGVDVEYNERVMATLAQESNGRHYFVETAAGLPRIFEQELQSLLSSVALNARLALDLAPGVEFVELLDRDFQREGSRIVVPLGSLAAGEEKTVLARVRVPAGSALGRRAVADLGLEFRDLVADGPGSCRGTLRAEFTTDAKRRAELDPFVAERLQRSETARTLTEANKLFRDGRVAEARRRIGESRSKLDSARKKVAQAPQASAPALGQNLDRQERALDEADEGFGLSEPEFAEPPAAVARGPGSTGGGSRPAAAPKPAEAAKRGSVQVRKNQEAAVDLAH